MALHLRRGQQPADFLLDRHRQTWTPTALRLDALRSVLTLMENLKFALAVRRRARAGPPGPMPANSDTEATVGPSR